MPLSDMLHHECEDVKKYKFSKSPRMNDPRGSDPTRVSPYTQYGKAPKKHSRGKKQKRY